MKNIIQFIVLSCFTNIIDNRQKLKNNKLALELLEKLIHFIWFFCNWWHKIAKCSCKTKHSWSTALKQIKVNAPFGWKATNALRVLWIYAPCTCLRITVPWAFYFNCVIPHVQPERKKVWSNANKMLIRCYCLDVKTLSSEPNYYMLYLST